MMTIHSSGRGGLLDANGGGLAHDFSHGSASTHYPNRTEPRFCNADIATCHEQVGDVSTVQAAVRCPIDALVRIALAAGEIRDELVAFKTLLKLFLGKMQVNMP